MARANAITLSVRTRTARRPPNPLLKTRPGRRVTGTASQGAEIWVQYAFSLSAAYRTLIDESLTKHGQSAVANMKSIVPVDTGRLRASIRMERPAYNYLILRAGGRALGDYYAFFVEFGFRHWLTGIRYPGRPFFFPNTKDVTRKVLKDIRGGAA